MRAEHFSAEEDQQNLHGTNRKHDDQKTFVFSNICQKADTARSRVERIEDTAENEQGKECRHESNEIAFKAISHAHGGKDQKNGEQRNGIGARDQNLFQHFSRDDRFLSAFRRFLHIGSLRRFSRKRKPRKRVYDNIDPKHLRYRHGSIHTNKRTDEGYANGAEIHRQLKDEKFPNAVKNRSAVKNGTRNGKKAIIQNADGDVI